VNEYAASGSSKSSQDEHDSVFDDDDDSLGGSGVPFEGELDCFAEFDSDWSEAEAVLS